MSSYIIERINYYGDLYTSHYAKDLYEIADLIRKAHPSHEVRNIKVDLENNKIECEMKDNESPNE